MSWSGYYKNYMLLHKDGDQHWWMNSFQDVSDISNEHVQLQIQQEILCLFSSKLLRLDQTWNLKEQFHFLKRPINCN